MKRFLIVFAVSFFVSSSAQAATLKSCRIISTASGPMYFGVYCVDYSCSVTTTTTFSLAEGTCPYTI